MMLAEQLPDAQSLLDLEPEELAGLLLVYLNDHGQRDVHPGNLINPSNREGFGSFPKGLQDELGRAFMEAWSWLEREGLIVRKPVSPSSEWMVVSRRGESIRTADDFQRFRSATMLPAGLLHSEIEQRTRGSFLRGDYETAVFQAVRAVEIRVREACGYTGDDHGAAMMRRAFAAGTGPLADPTAPTGEQEGLAHLFAGAIQYIRNGTAHRQVDIDAAEALELLMFSSHLLRIVGRRRVSSP